jgi:hypothetical protein
VKFCLRKFSAVHRERLSVYSGNSAKHSEGFAVLRETFAVYRGVSAKHRISNTVHREYFAMYRESLAKDIHQKSAAKVRQFSDTKRQSKIGAKG